MCRKDSTASSVLSPLDSLRRCRRWFLRFELLVQITFVLVYTDFYVFSKLTLLFLFSRSKQRGKKRSPRNQERERRKSTLRMQKYIRKKTLESLGLTEDDHAVEFGHNQTAPSLPPSPGRNESKLDHRKLLPSAMASVVRRVELPPPSAATVAQIQGATLSAAATTSQRAQHILQACCKSTSKPQRAVI